MSVCFKKGKGFEARKQAPIVQYGVMRAVMRVWVSRAVHYKCTAAGPSGELVSPDEGRWVSVKIEELIALNNRRSQTTTQGVEVTLDHNTR